MAIDKRSNEMHEKKNRNEEKNKVNKILTTYTETQGSSKRMHEQESS